MRRTDLVLVDTCIWASFFSRPQSAVKRAVDELIDEKRAAVIGPILAEILCGFRKDAVYCRSNSALRSSSSSEALAAMTA